MKNKIYILSIVAVAICFASCKKTLTDITYSGNGTAPILSANTDSISLLPADSSNTAIALSWTNPNYAFSNGISSLNVKYIVRLDTAGANISNSTNILESDSSNLSTQFTVTKLNAFLGNTLLLSTGVPHNIQIQVESYLNQNSLPLYSNVLSYTVTPYSPPPKITPPSSGTLYIVGAATAGGWDNPIDLVDPATQQFTQVSPTEYTITIALTGGAEYKTIAVNGSWTDQWSVATADTEPNGGAFVYNGANSIAPATSGTYKIDFNFQTGMFTVTPQ